MKLERRSAPTAGAPVEQPEEQEVKGKKPVVIYIMILFIAAFLLMAWSFASHQRSNTEALGRLQSSVGAMQEVQELQDQIIQLQRELSAAEKRVEELESEAEDQQSAQEARDRQLEAMELLYALQQRYSAQNYEACREIIGRLEADSLWGALSDNQGSPDNVTSPAERYRQLKEATEARLAEAEAQESDGAAS